MVMTTSVLGRWVADTGSRTAFNATFVTIFINTMEGVSMEVTAGDRRFFCAGGGSSSGIGTRRVFFLLEFNFFAVFIDTEGVVAVFMTPSVLSWGITGAGSWPANNCTMLSLVVLTDEGIAVEMAASDCRSRGTSD